MISADERQRAGFDLPADPEMWTLARMGISAIAAHLDFGIDEVEDLRLAVSELCSSCAVGSTAASRIVLECTWDDDDIEVRCEVTAIKQGDAEAGLLREVEFSRRILKALADEYDIGELREGTRGGWFRKGRESKER